MAILVEFFRLKVRFVRTGTTDFNSNFSARWRDILFRNSFLHIRTAFAALILYEYVFFVFSTGICAAIAEAMLYSASPANSSCITKSFFHE